MKKEDPFSINKSSFIQLFNNNELNDFKFAGKIVNKCLEASKFLIIENNNITTKDIEEECSKIINDNNCSPTFYMYKGFPGKICASVNKEVVHGIPSDYKIKSGDIVKIDLGVTYNGAIADAAITAIAGNSCEHVNLVEKCREALNAAILSVSVGKRVGVIGETIYNLFKNSNFRVITEMGGHGIQINKVHSEPFISNKDSSNNGLRFQNGMVFTIEPMITEAINGRIKPAKNGWTMLSDGMAAHFEHTLCIENDCVFCITG